MPGNIQVSSSPYHDQHAARLEPRAAAAEERQHHAQRADGDKQRVCTKCRMVGQQCGVAAVGEAQPEAGTEEGASAQLQTKPTSK